MALRLASLSLLPGLLALPAAVALADDDPVNETYVQAVLDQTKVDFVKQHLAPGRRVAFDYDEAAFFTDEDGNQAFMAFVFGGVTEKGAEEGRGYVAQLTVFLDPDTEKPTYTLTRLDDTEGWDTAVVGFDDLVIRFPEPAHWTDGDEAVVGEEAGPDAGNVVPAEKWTAHAQDLRKYASELQAALAIIKSWEPVPDDPDEAVKWAKDLQEEGYRAVDAVDAYSLVLSEFVDPVTRAGWTSDILVAQDNVDRVIEIVEEYARVLEVKIEKGPDDAEAVRQEVDRDLQLYLARKIGEHFDSQGVTAVASSESREQAKAIAIERIKAKLKQRADQITQRRLRVPFHNARTACAAARHRLRQLARARIAELICNITSKPFVVTFVGEVIVNLIEGALTDAFRGTGRHPERVAVSTGTLRAARIRLYQLPPDAYLEDVRAELRRAEGTQNATVYLVGDLAEAKSPLLQDYVLQIKYLAQARTFTEKRFLLTATGDLEDLKSEAALVAALAGLLRQIIDGIEVPDTVVEEDEDKDYDEWAKSDPPDEDGEPEKQKVPLVKYDPPVFLFHICKWYGPNGPVDRDYWYATDAPPKPEDGKGIGVANQQGTIDICEWDGRQGPFPNNHSLLKAIAATKQNSAYFRGNYISGNPDP
jgi:hypothetical protein